MVLGVAETAGQKFDGAALTKGVLLHSVEVACARQAARLL